MHQESSLLYMRRNACAPSQKPSLVIHTGEANVPYGTEAQNNNGEQR